MVTAVLLTIAGLLLLVAGGELLVRGAVNLANRLGVSALLTGIVIVGFGTSAPELVASLEAVRLGSPGIAWGNVIGSNIANILLILGATAILQPVIVPSEALKRDGGVMLASTLGFFGLALTGTMPRLAGIAGVACLCAYLYASYRLDRRGPSVHDEEAKPAERPRRRVRLWAWGRPILFILTGLGLLVGGGNLLVTGAQQLAGMIGLPESVIGVTIVALGTSAPELATSVIAALRKHGDIAFGNIVGSNIYNLLGIGGVIAIAAPNSVPPALGDLELWVLLAATIASGFFATTHTTIHRWEGALLFLGFVAFNLAVFLGA